MGLISLTYISAAPRNLSPMALIDILETSRRKNPANNVTGLLVFQNSIFVQVLEGDERDVDATFQRIEKDERHQNVKVIERVSIERRAFPGWSMGFKNLDAMDAKEAGNLREFLNNPLTPTNAYQRPDMIVRLVETIKQEYGQ